MPKDKTDNFLKAIKKYAKEQKTAMHGEVKQLKTERLKEAEEEAREMLAEASDDPEMRELLAEEIARADAAAEKNLEELKKISRIFLS